MSFLVSYASYGVVPKGMTMREKSDLEQLNWEISKGHSCMLNIQALGMQRYNYVCPVPKENLNLVEAKAQLSMWGFSFNTNKSLNHTFRLLSSLNYIFMKGV